MRNTDIRERVDVISRHTGVRLELDWLGRRPRITFCGRDVSPRLTPKMMALWLDGYEAHTDLLEAINRRNK